MSLGLDNSIARMALVSTQPTPNEIPGTGPYDAVPSNRVVVPDIQPYNERIQDTQVNRGSAPNPYDPPISNYPAPGPIGWRQNAALSYSMRQAYTEGTYPTPSDAAARPGLTGYETMQGGGNGAVIYDVASIQLYMRPAPLPPPQELGMGSIY